MLTIWCEAEDRRRRAFAQLEKLRSEPETAERAESVALYERIIKDAERLRRQAEMLLGFDPLKRTTLH